MGCGAPSSWRVSRWHGAKQLSARRMGFLVGGGRQQRSGAAGRLPAAEEAGAGCWLTGSVGGGGGNVY